MNPNNFNLLRGALPGPPQMQAPTPPAPIQAVSSAQPTLPYQQQGVGGVVDAIQNFVNNYRISSESQKRRSMEDAERDLRLLSIGVPVNQEKLAKNLKKAGLELDYEAPRPMVADPSRPAQNVVVPTNSPVPGAEGMQSQVPQGMMQAPPPPPPGMWDRIKNFAMPSRQPGIAPNSPAMQWIAQLAQQGQQNQELEQKQRALQFLTMDNAKNAQTIMKGVYDDNPDAQRLARQSGLLQMTPYDQFAIAGKKAGLSEDKISQLYVKSIIGPDKMAEMMYKQAGDIADRFPSFEDALNYMKALYNGETPKVQPGFTLKEKLDIDKRAVEERENQPMLSQAQATALVLARITGNREVVDAYDKVLSKMPSMASLGMAEKQLGMLDKQDQMRHRKEIERISSWNAATAEKGLALRKQLNVIQGVQALNSTMSGLFEDAYKVMVSKDADPKEVAAMKKLMAESISGRKFVNPVSGEVTTAPKVTAQELPGFLWGGSGKFILKGVGDEYTEGNKPGAPKVEMPAFEKWLTETDWSQQWIATEPLAAPIVREETYNKPMFGR